mgnify:CR=1 FL=1
MIKKFSQLTKKQKGDFGERIAKQYYLQNGHKVVEENYHTLVGEIDLITYKNHKHYFIEAKFNINKMHGSAFERWRRFQSKRFIKAAKYFIAKKNIDIDLIQIDFIEFVQIKDTKVLLHRYKNLNLE